MLYKDALDYLNNINFSKSKYRLETITALMEELGDPQEVPKIVHISGTNGKGSILAFSSNILKTAGYKVGCYTSPAVFDYRERYTINGEWIKEEEFGPLVEKVKAAAEIITEKGFDHPTVFEMETAVAFLYFYEQKCNFVVLECGMGGELDSTNVIKSPVVCAFAKISEDHLGMLGNNIVEIAQTKSGIIKPNASVVTGCQKDSVYEVLNNKAKACNDKCYPVDVSLIIRQESNEALEQVFSYKQYENAKIKLLGAHQMENAAVALEVINALKDKGFEISDEAVYEGLYKTVWPGRFEVLKAGKRTVIIDGAHNEDAAKRLAESLDTYFKGQKFDTLIGVFKDKEYIKVTDLLKGYMNKAAAIDLPNKARTLPKEELKEELERKGVKTECFESIKDALLSLDGNLLITGSLSFLGAAKEQITDLI